ncbi:MAG: DUF4091 domain-containing protein [Bacteroidaceae bacterium]|nr:DUF4091 domain-containing protein [Bacteroidaceae bacterium]
MKSLKTLLTLAMALLVTMPLAAQTDAEPTDPYPGSQEAWANLKKPTAGWGSIDLRYSRSQIPTFEKKLTLHAWRGERVGALALIATPQDGQLSFEISNLKSGKHTIASSQVKKYYVRYVLSDKDVNRNDSILTGDRLAPADQPMTLAANTTRPMWLDVHVPEDAAPGKYTGTVTIYYNNVKHVLPLTLEVVDRVLPAPSEWSFHLDLWQNPYAVARYFDVPLWSKQHFDLMRPTMELLAAAGEKVITCSIIQRPWNGQTEDPFESMIAKMKTVDGQWKYDYTVFDRWVEFMIGCGITKQIDCYTLVPWHYRFDYFDLATNSVKYVACKPGEKAYEDFILPFLKDFAAHLKQKGWFSRTCIAMDERPMDQLKAAYDLVRRADPEYKIEGAFNYFPEVVSMVHDVSVAYQYKLLDERVLTERRQNGTPVTFYTCCSPNRPNTFTFSPPAESAFMGWHAMAAGYDGYLRWAYNSWVKDPNSDARFRTWASGDCFLVYPGGSSIRMERLTEGIQDYEKLRILKQTASEKQLQRISEVLETMRPNVLDPSVEAADLLKTGKALLRELE